jgi:hypothetical protein
MFGRWSCNVRKVEVQCVGGGGEMFGRWRCNVREGEV